LFTFDEHFGDHGKAVSINRYGFYNPGDKTGAYNILKLREKAEIVGPVIAQITLNKEFYEDASWKIIPQIVRLTARNLLPAVDGINLGLSSLNTKNMREAQNSKSFLYEIVAAAQDEIRSSSNDTAELILKGDGDGGPDRLDIYCELAQETGCHLELINSTGLAKIKTKYRAEEQAGGLAGADPDYRELAVASVGYVYQQVGDKVSIIGVGGVGGPEVYGGIEQATALIEAGASAIAFNTYFRTGGLKSFTNVKRGIAAWLDEQEDINKLTEAIGRKTKRGPNALTV
jgi:dihydroorotate dehydrogenase